MHKDTQDQLGPTRRRAGRLYEIGVPVVLGLIAVLIVALLVIIGIVIARGGLGQSTIAPAGATCRGVVQDIQPCLESDPVAIVTVDRGNVSHPQFEHTS